MKKKINILLVCIFTVLAGSAQGIFSEQKKSNTFPVSEKNACSLLVDENDIALVQTATALLQNDITMVTGKKPLILRQVPREKHIIIIGSINQSVFLQQLIAAGKINTDPIKGQWEAYQVQTIDKPFPGVDGALVIAGSDARGTAYGIFELSRRMGVSPWYWWADVPVKKKTSLYYDKSVHLADAPKVHYRGIFINDEAPALSNWSKEKFGGFNHLFYARVFELMLRLKANYLWPAMWGNAFYDDDSLNIKTAEQYGIVIGTSHHEPLMRAHDEWRRYGQGKWNYDSNQAALKKFWTTGMKRATNEKVVTIGMRGDGDEPMSRETATALLERIVKDQRQIIENVTGHPAHETPQLWALYKEVQDYYDKGMRVPDDVTLLLCDDNWGNIRKLPKPGEPSRKGGYGIYYHFDYVGGPRNYKWLNTNPIPRIWEQMHLAWEYNARQIWIVNVGDIKPMEFPISFWCDYAWNPESISADDLQTYTEKWCAEQFGATHAKFIAAIITLYSQYNGRRKPELLDADTYSLNYEEWKKVVHDYNDLLMHAAAIQDQLPAEYRDAFFQLVLHPVKACANLHEMYYNVALNREAYQQKQGLANIYADRVKQLFVNDSLITLAYHRLNNGKWNHMMDQTHIGYTNWQQPPVNKMPMVKYLSPDSIVSEFVIPNTSVRVYHGPVKKNNNGIAFGETNEYVAIEAPHFSAAINSPTVNWKVIPGLGRTGNAITPFPVTAGVQVPGGNSPHLEYEFYTYSMGTLNLQAYFSPTLNFFNSPEGLQYAVSIDDEAPQIISINKEDKNSISGIWNKWVADNIIIKNTAHTISQPGRHILKYWMVHPGVVLQKLVIDMGGVKQSYLGPPETLLDKKNIQK
ncbi:MAG: glycosyhydrolase [Terrimonas sp.]|nr:glycosyhydrolase [Terrimonas sp.]